MHRKINTAEMEAVCRTLIRERGHVTVRELRAAIRERLGAVGRTDRVLEIWRRLGAGADAGAVSAADIGAWQARVQAAEERARLAEVRERAHQDRWADEVSRLREQLKQANVASQVPYRIYDQHREALRQVLELKARVAELERGSQGT